MHILTRFSPQVVVYGVSSIESSFAFHVAKGPDSWTHEDQPALTVARAVLNAMEGYLWKFIRGAGLAYGASISQDLESGLVYYRVRCFSPFSSLTRRLRYRFHQVYKSPDSHAAFVAARNLIDQLVSGEVSRSRCPPRPPPLTLLLPQLEIDDLTIESAKSSLAYNTAAKESTINDAVRFLSRRFTIKSSPTSSSLAGQCFLHQLASRSSRRLRQDRSCQHQGALSPFSSSFPSQADPLRYLQDVTAQDIVRVIKTWIAPIFRAETSIGSIASGLAKQEDIAKHFEELGYEVESRTFEVSDSDESGSESGSELGSESGSESGSEEEK
jgi:hypothetical protein